MSEWWTYRLEDFLLFSPRVYWRMFELHNGAVWPLQVVAIIAGLAILALAIRRPPRGGLAIGLLLAAAWAFVGWAFLWNRYAGINWSASYVAPFFGLQAVALVLAGLSGRLIVTAYGARVWAGLLLAAAALVLYPLVPLAMGRPLASAEIFGIAPDPTAIFTLGILLTMRGVPAKLLSLIPLVWLLFSGLTLQTMGEAQVWLPFAALGLVPTLMLISWRRR